MSEINEKKKQKGGNLSWYKYILIIIGIFLFIFIIVKILFPKKENRTTSEIRYAPWEFDEQTNGNWEIPDILKRHISPSLPPYQKIKLN